MISLFTVVPKVIKQIMNISNPIFNQSTHTPDTYLLDNWLKVRRENFSSAGCVYNQLNPSQKALGGEEISSDDLTIPPI